MKTIFDEATRTLLIHRIKRITPALTPAWGKMKVQEMLRHNTYWNGWMLGHGKPAYKQALLGKIFGKIALRRMTKDESPFDQNIPTSGQFKMKGTTAELEAEKLKWVAMVHEYEHYHNPHFVHDFFGKMTKEQIGILVYKHTDHHLRQFGV